MVQHNIYTLGLAKIDSNYKAHYVANYINDKSFTDDVLSLITRQDFNICSGQSEAFTHNSLTYLFTGGQDNIVYYIVTKNEYPTRVLAKCTQDLKNYYTHCKNNGNKIDTNLLIKICARYDDPAEIDKLAKVQQKVDSIKSVMQSNIDIAIQNCVKLENIEKQTDELQHAAGVFKKTAIQLEKKMWWKNMRMQIIIVVIILVIIAIIIGVIVGISQQKN